MWILLISLLLLAIVAMIAGYIRNRRLQKDRRRRVGKLSEVKEVDAECCGQHEVCEKTACWLL